MKLIDLKGEKFGRLTVIDRGPNTNARKARWHCRCECGNRPLVDGRDLRRGKTKSCGCRNGRRKQCTKHGMSGSKIYSVWAEMKARSQNPEHKDFRFYGGRGITVCDDWKRASGFPAFYKWAMASGYKEALTIDRIDVDGNYSPENCRWVTRAEQNRNRRDTKYIEIDGERMSIIDWAEKAGITATCLRRRLKRYSEFDHSILQPPTRGKNAKKDQAGPYVLPFNWKKH